MATTVVDPADGMRLANPRPLGEWNTANNFEAWTVAGATSSRVASGALSVTGNVPVQVALANVGSGPDLDLGGFDYLQIRLKLPAASNQDVVFSFGTSTHPGYAADRSFAITAGQIPKDGNWHTYRMDLGLDVWWRDTFRDLQVQVLGFGTTATASIDYVEIGDQPHDTLTPYTTDLNMAPGVTEESRQSMESKHFVFWWDPAVNPGNATDFVAAGRRALRMLEESYQVYTKVLGLKEPFSYAGDGQRHKVNLTTWYGGYWMGGPYLNVDTSGLADEGCGNPVPHEFGHVIDSQQGAFLAGGHWESHANYLREARTNWFAPLFPNEWQSTMDLGPLAWSNYHQDAKRLIYADYRIFTALQNYAADPQLGAKLWSVGIPNQTVYDKLATLLPPGTSVKDVVASTMRRWPMLDFSTRALLRARLWSTASARAEYDFRTGSPLIPAADKSGWFQVPPERAPEKYAFMVHDLRPTSRTVTVNLRGLTTIDSTQDWRWCLQEVDANDNVRYSDVWGPGQHSFTLTSTANRLLLFVIATPGDTSLDLESLSNAKQTGRSIDRLQYPYEVRLVGATPVTGAGERIAYAPATGHPHPNGGGWVDDTASVAPTAYVGPNARVLGWAQVLDRARIEDYAVVADAAQIRDGAIVSGYAVVQDDAVVQGRARVRDHAMVVAGSVLQDDATVGGFARVENTTVQHSAIVRGNAFPFGGTISGTAIADYDYSMAWSFTTGTHFGHVPWGDWFGDYYDATQAKPRGLLASYRVDQPAGELLWDEFGVGQAVLRGSPRVVEDPMMKSRVLEFSGSRQYAVLDRKLADLTSATYGLWIKPTSARANETLLFFGSSATTWLKLVGRDAGGRARLTLSVNGARQELVSTRAVPRNQWTHLAVTMDGVTATIYLNGQAAGSTPMAFRPVDVLGANTLQNAEPTYLGRDATGGFFTGRMDDIRFYNIVLTPAEITAEMGRAGPVLGQFFMFAPMTFDGATTMFQSGVHNGFERTLEARIRPRAPAGFDLSYKPVIDSGDELDPTRPGSGFGLEGGQIVVKLDGLGSWRTGVLVTFDAWQRVTVAFNGTTARLSVDGVLRASTTYAAEAETISNKNYRIGFGQSGPDASTRTFFAGDISNLTISDRMLAPSIASGGSRRRPHRVPSGTIH